MDLGIKMAFQMKERTAPFDKEAVLKEEFS